MTSEIRWVFCVLVVLTGASRAAGETTARPPVPTSTVPSSPATPNLTGKDPRHEARQRKQNPADRNGTSAETTTASESGAGVVTQTGTGGASAAYAQRETVSVFTTAPTGSVSPSAAAHGLSSDPTARTLAPPQRGSTAEGGPLLTGQTLTTFSSQPTHTDHDASPTVTSSTSTTQLQPVTTGTTQTPAPGWGPAGPTHREVPPELNVGDEEGKGPSSPLDPLLAGLLSVFIVITAIVFVVLFLKFRHRTNHPEFHRLQDLPMDDLMEDTPLSRYTY